MSEQYLKQSLVKKKKGWVINRDDPNRYYPTKKAALEWIGDSTAELRASQGGGK
nr:hypothetical protein [Deltaproteobacteria bacterium]